MQTKKHWEECNTQPSYMAANNIALQLKDFAKSIGYDPKSIHVLSKEKSRRYGHHADAVVSWKDGPSMWVDDLEIKDYGNVYVEKDINGLLYIFDFFNNGEMRG